MTAPLDDPVALAAQLISIDSVNPGLVPGADGESAIADFVSDWFVDRGFKVDRLETNAGRPSIVAIAAGSGGGKSLMFNGHLDTVTLAGYDGDPLVPMVEDGKLYGRGSFDMKAGIAAMMIAAANLTSRPHSGDILVALVADEEYGSAGTEEVLQRYTADGAIVSEPSHEELTLAHRGFAWFDVTIHGVAAHGSRPDLGIDAIAKAGRFLTGLEVLARKLERQTGHPILGSGNIHASTIHGGEEISSYPARCTISIERRTIPGETAATVEAELREILNSIAATDQEFEYTIAPGLERKPFSIRHDDPLVQTILPIVKQVTGRPPVIRGEPFWTDAALMQAAGIPSLIFGVDGGGAHAATEWVEIESLQRVTRILTDAASQFCI